MQNYSNMNSDEESIQFYLTFVFKVDLEGSLSFSEGIWPYLAYFMTYDEAANYYQANAIGKTKTSGYLRIQKIFVDMLTQVLHE